MWTKKNHEGLGVLDFQCKEKKMKQKQRTINSRKIRIKWCKIKKKIRKINVCNIEENRNRN